MLGISSALVMEHLDDKIRSAEEIQRVLHLPTLGVVPDAQKLKTAQHHNLNNNTFDFIVWEAPRSPVSEAVRNVKTSIFLSAPPSSLQTLVVTSAGPAEGKTFISLSLSTVMSSREKRVLLIDADMRRPRVAKVFGQRNSIGGLSTLLTRDDVKLSKLIRRSNIPGFYYLTAGPIPPDPVRLLESNRMRELTADFRKYFDIVVFDAPPIVGFSDAQILSSFCDGTVLVAREGCVPMDILAQAKTMAEVAQANTLGVVLNMAKGGTSYYGKYRYHKYYSRYYSYYSSDDPKRKQRNELKGNGRFRRSSVTRGNKVDRIKV
jgi:capsular exopolysaccharide synthesis family protein